MNTKVSNTIVVLKTGLFPDVGTLESCLLQNQQETQIRQHNLDAQEMSDTNWDEALRDILGASVVITL